MDERASAGHEIIGPAAGIKDPYADGPPEWGKLDLQRMLLAGLAFMALFFAFGLFLGGSLSGMQGMVIVSLVLAAAGIIMLAMRPLLLRRHRRQVTRWREDNHVQCQYCGGTGHRSDHQCRFCGAPL